MERTNSPTSADAVEKGEDALSQAAASRTVGILRAMVRVLGRVLAEEEQILAAKKGERPNHSPLPLGEGPGVRAVLSPTKRPSP